MSDYKNYKILPRDFDSFAAEEEENFFQIEKIIEKLEPNYIISSRKVKIFNWFLILCIAIVVGYMFKVKNYVQDLSYELKQLVSQIDHEKNQYSLLKAELSYLKSPERLQRLASQYLNLEQIKPDQLVVESDKSHGITEAKFIELANKKPTNKWRYKKSQNHIHTVSVKQ